MENKKKANNWKIILAVFIILSSVLTLSANLRILTINVWSGLDYKGTLRMGEYEKKEQRKARFKLLVKQIKQIRPDIIFVQEANPVAGYSSKLAQALGFDEIHQVCIGGIKFGPLGIPSNLKEGNAILARPELNLKKYDVWKLSGSFGIYGDVITIHFNESILTIVGKIVIDSIPIYLVNVHLVYSPSEDPGLLNSYKELLTKGEISKEEYMKGLNKCSSKNRQRKNEVRRLLKCLSKLPPGSPVILAGDFNATPGSPEIQMLKNPEKRDIKFFETFSHEKSELKFTWSPITNKNIKLSLKIEETKGDLKNGYERLSALFERREKKIDYIFLSHHFHPENVCDSRIVLSSTENGTQVSDHYGVFSEISLENVLKVSPKEEITVKSVSKPKFEFFPIIMWDTDIGFGYGLKMFYLNPLKLNESFDLVLFNSSKGERWYRFVFSWPDLELRQGKIYPLSFDLLVDYDKWIKNSFFGIGNEPVFGDREYYTREPFEINLALSRGFSTKMVGQVGVRYKTIRNFNFEEGSHLSNIPPEINQSRATFTSIFTNLRYDTRDSFINPARGLVLQGEAEFAIKTKFSNVQFSRISTLFQYYSILFYPKTVMALRLWVQSLFGEELPIQVLLPVGGNRTIRGYPQDRFLGKSSAVINAELRFPIFWKLGGILGFDAGKVWNSLSEIDLPGWAINPTFGLRFYMSNFIVRVDIGLGKDSTGLYFNFGHIF